LEIFGSDRHCQCSFGCRAGLISLRLISLQDRFFNPGIRAYLYGEDLFSIVATLAVGAGFSVLLQRSPLYGAFSLIGLFGCLAVIYVTLQAQFIATIQIIVYAGAIMVRLFL